MVEVMGQRGNKEEVKSEDIQSLNNLPDVVVDYRRSNVRNVPVYQVKGGD
jgi:hypothetical protein